jgi:sensor histidine kinase YesM
MKDNRPHSFKENIQRIFTLYSIVPAFMIACMCLLAIVIIWQYTTTYTTRTENAKKTELLCNMVEQYQELLDEYSDDTGFFGAERNEVKSAEVFHRMYQIANETGFSAKFYFVTTDGQMTFGSSQEVPDYLTNPEYANWGIRYQMQQKPDEAVLYVNTTGSSSLCMGKAVCQENEICGYMVIVLEAESFSRLIAEYFCQTVITDENGWIFLANQYTFLDNLGRFEGQQKNTSEAFSYREKGYCITGNAVFSGELYVYSILDTQIRTRMIWLMIVLVIGIFAAITGISYYSIEGMAEKNTRDVDEIAAAFARVQEGDLDTKLEIDSSTEFMSISESYNQMVESLKEQIATNKELAEHMAFAQVKQLESQFNPHFIFNTLDNIRFMVKIDEKAADKMIVALSEILRYSISNAGEASTVKEDLDYMESYLTIVKYRFNRRFTYQIDIDEEIMDCYIPKLVIQPLIENAIKYGYADRDTLRVNIRGYEKGDKLIFVCEDNGAGMDEELLAEIRENLKHEKNTSSHLGLYNVHRRIFLLYKNIGDYGVRIDSKKGQGTVVTLVLPVNRKRSGV